MLTDKLYKPIRYTSKEENGDRTHLNGVSKNQIRFCDKKELHKSYCTLSFNEDRNRLNRRDEIIPVQEPTLRQKLWQNHTLQTLHILTSKPVVRRSKSHITTLLTSIYTCGFPHTLSMSPRLLPGNSSSTCILHLQLFVLDSTLSAGVKTQFSNWQI